MIRDVEKQLGTVMVNESEVNDLIKEDAPLLNL